MNKSKTSFLNEIRGTLLEFSCGLNFAQSTIGEAKFIKDLGKEKIKDLSQYQDYCREIDPHGYRFISRAGRDFSEKVAPILNSNISRIILTGKDSDKKKYFESDISIESEIERKLISLKLIKKDAFINTKSAGTKSFILNYFESQDFQTRLCQKNDLAFQNMVYKFNQFFGVDGESHKPLSDLLRENKVSDRPGDLNPDLKKFVFEFYREVIDEIYAFCKISYNNSPKKFLERLYPLMGLSHPSILLGIFEYSKNFSTSHFKIYDHNTFSSRDILIHPVSGNTSFSIELDKLFLQIRVKPMNSFVSPGLKVNCSIKFKEG